jgi:hypothetical protein
MSQPPRDAPRIDLSSLDGDAYWGINKMLACLYIQIMRTTSFVPTSELTTCESSHARALPRGCTLSESDWRVLSPFWYPVAFSHEITRRPHAVTLLDERLVALSSLRRLAVRHKRHLPPPGSAP